MAMDSDRWYELATEKMKAGAYDEAEDLLKNSLQFNTDHPTARLDLAICRIHLGKLDLALMDYETLVGAKPDDTELKLQYGGLLLMLDRSEMAEGVFRNVLGKDPKLVDAKKGLADALFRQQNFKDSLSIYDDLINQNPDDAFLHFSKAEILYRYQHHEAAFESVEKAIELEHRPEFFAFKGDFFIRHDNYERALEQYRLAANLDRRNPEIWMRLGFIFRILDRLKDALEAFEKAFKFDDSFLEALLNKIEVLDALGQTEAARATKERVIRQFPSEIKLAMPLIHEYMDAGGYERAGELLEILIDEHPDNEEVWYSLSYSMLQIGQEKRALQAIDHAIRIDEENSDFQDLRLQIKAKVDQKIEQEGQNNTT